jgi:hypothetical protein
VKEFPRPIRTSNPASSQIGRRGSGRSSSGGRRWWRSQDCAGSTRRWISTGGDDDALCRVRVLGVEGSNSGDTPVRFLAMKEVMVAVVGGGVERRRWCRLDRGR